ncbi:hypothetical protein SVIO_051860 [Streptomyces violaceusniger]|uniref:Uncharacterized protein n=2 Tax=Streptomyces violaceusniger TaxID=68280 RepID=A0A4D4L921_STRVO|nr:hypothetical protein SVIO_051860 [Streptomyces violaceusniger]
MVRVGSAAAMQNPDPSSLPDLTDAQIQKLLSTAWERIKKLIEGMDLANEYYGEGGCDRETWNQICDGLSREAMGLMMVLSGPAHPYMAKDCERAVRVTAGVTPREGGMREALLQQVAKGLLKSVLTAGQHHMVEPEEWPDLLPEAVLGAVRSAKRIKSDPTMANLRDSGFPA